MPGDILLNLYSYEIVLQSIQHFLILKVLILNKKSEPTVADSPLKGYIFIITESYCNPSKGSFRHYYYLNDFGKKFSFLSLFSSFNGHLRKTYNL